MENKKKVKWVSMTDYKTLNDELFALISGVPHKIANLSNAAALLFHSMTDLNWAGFYLLEGEKLILGPFQGKPACIEISIGKGVCGTAVANRKTQLVEDVHKFPGHIACDSASKSEIVVPLFCGDKIVGVLDIDSPKFCRFNDTDKVGLEAFAHILETEIFRKGDTQ